MKRADQMLGLVVVLMIVVQLGGCYLFPPSNWKNMVLVEGCVFVMGDTFSDQENGATLKHEVLLSYDF